MVVNYAPKFYCRGKQLTVGFRPLGCVGKLVGVIEDTFQSSEAGIFGLYLPFRVIRRSALNAQGESRAYRLDVVTHFLHTVISHCPRRIE